MKRHLTHAAACAMLLAAPVASSAQDVDLRILSGVIGYGTGQISDIQGTPTRAMSGFHVRADLHLLSLALRRLAAVRVYDALFVDLTRGNLTSAPLTDNVGPEGTSSMTTKFGYHLLAGRRVAPGVKVLGGVGWYDVSPEAGRTYMEARSQPIVARAEFGGAKRIIAMAALGVSGDAYQSARVDIPFFRRLYLTAMYWSVEGKANVFNGSGNAPAKARMLSVGFRSIDAVD